MTDSNQAEHASSGPPSPRPGTWLASAPDALVRVVLPIRKFLGIEAASGILLGLATIIALVWANSGFAASYTTLWHTEIVVSIGRWTFHASLMHLVNDGLMAIFFFVVGLEIKWQWLHGELRDRRTAALPIIAALGGMVVPALLYIAFASGTAGSHGWGIPMATDIAFAIGVVALLGQKVPTPLKVFLLTLAIVDDLGAIAVIAVFYSGALAWGWITAAAVGMGIVALLNLAKVKWLPAYAVVGLVVWFATWQSGIHATIAGVVLAFATPAIARQSDEEAEAIVDTLENRASLDVEEVRWVSALVMRSVSPLERLYEALHPWSSFVIVPLFALANAGVVLSGGFSRDGRSVALGVLVGLVVGKCVGISVASWLAVRAGVASLPRGVSWLQLVGVAAIAGIGFTMSLFVTDLAFIDSVDGAGLAQASKTAVFAASLCAAALGATLLSVAQRRSRQRMDQA